MSRTSRLDVPMTRDRQSLNGKARQPNGLPVFPSFEQPVETPSRAAHMMTVGGNGVCVATPSAADLKSALSKAQPPVSSSPRTMAFSNQPDDTLHTRFLSRRVSEESIRTELCEGPILDDPIRAEPHIESEVLLASPGNDVSAVTSDRAELIERLKRGESPTWVPSRHVSVISPSAPPTNHLGARVQI